MITSILQGGNRKSLHPHCNDHAICSQFTTHRKLFYSSELPRFGGESKVSAFRKRFSKLIATGILDEENITVQLIQSRCRSYSGLENTATRGPSGQIRLTLPEQPSMLEKLIQFMCEDLYVGELTGQERVTNSSRVVSNA